jgi:hypothetical protein
MPIFAQSARKPKNTDFDCYTVRMEAKLRRTSYYVVRKVQWRADRPEGLRTQKAAVVVRNPTGSGILKTMSPQASLESIFPPDNFDTSWISVSSFTSCQQIVEECRLFYALGEGEEDVQSPIILRNIAPRLEDALSDKKESSREQPVERNIPPRLTDALSDKKNKSSRAHKARLSTQVRDNCIAYLDSCANISHCPCCSRIFRKTSKHTRGRQPPFKNQTK